MLKGLLLALAIIWPPHVEVSSGVICRVVFTAKAEGDCDGAKERLPGLAYWWRTCLDIEWAGRGPHGEDIVAEMPIWSGDSRHKALAQCEKALAAYEKVRKAK